MARVVSNLVIHGVRGRLGDALVLKRGRNGQTILSKKPTFAKNRKFSAAQAAHQQRFREATRYAAAAARRVPVYAELAKKLELTAYNVAVADFMHPPEILEVDLAGYGGQAGGVIRVLARDDVCVKEVRVRVVGGDEGVVEEGAACREAVGLGWVFTATVDCPAGGVQVVARAVDLPGHAAERVAGWR